MGKSSKKAISRARSRILLDAQRKAGMVGWDMRSVVGYASNQMKIPVPTTKVLRWEMLRQWVGAEAIPVRVKAPKPKPPLVLGFRNDFTKDFIVSDEFLSTYQWRRLRMEVVKERGARCECCGATPKDGIVINVDHIKPRRKYPELALEKSNLQVLCNPCNHGKGSWDETDWRAS